MDITISMDRTYRRRDIKMASGDQLSVNVVVYANEDDVLPVTVTNKRILVWPSQTFTVPADGTTFTVPDEWPGYWSYRLVGIMEGNQRTLCWGTMEIFGGERYGYPRGDDYGWGWPEPYPWR